MVTPILCGEDASIMIDYVFRPTIIVITNFVGSSRGILISEALVCMMCRSYKL